MFAIRRFNDAKDGDAFPFPPDCNTRVARYLFICSEARRMISRCEQRNPAIWLLYCYVTVQLHYRLIDKLSNDTVPNHTYITTNHVALFIYNVTKFTG